MDLNLRLFGRKPQTRRKDPPPVSIQPEDRTFRYCLVIAVILSSIGSTIQVILATDEAGLTSGLHPIALIFLPLAIGAVLRRDYSSPFLFSETYLVPFFALYVIAYSAVLGAILGGLNLPAFLVYFTYGTLIIRSMSKLHDRNVYQLVFLTVGMTLVNCILTNHMLYALALPVYLFALLGSLMTFSSARHRRAAPAHMTDDARADPPRRWTRSLALYTVFVVALTFVMFIGLPRPFTVMPGLQAAFSGGAGGPARTAQRISYRDMVNAGDRHRIAFLVEFLQGKPSGPPYWRGRVLEKTDGFGWESAKKHRARGRLVKFEDHESLVYRIMPHRLQSDYLYVYGLPVGAWGLRNRPLSLSDLGRVTIDSPFLVSDNYVVQVVDRPIPAEYPLVKEYWNTDGVTPRIRQLAEEWTRGTTTPKEKADAILNRLNREYRYRLVNRVPPADGHPIEYFLFVTREGNCEYFAGAMGLMLRAVNVPCRLVEGFMGMEKTPEADEFIVRFANAHAWVEALVEGRHWTRYDPTPPAPPEAAPNPVWKFLRTAYDRAEYQWVKSVVHFDQWDQRSMLRKVRRLVRGEIPLSRVVSNPVVMSIGGLAVVAILVVVPVAAVRRRRAAHDPAGIYRKTLEQLVRGGALTRVHQWHEANLSEAGEKSPQLGNALGDFNRAYLAVRFGPNSPETREDLENARKRLLDTAQSL